MTEEEKTKQIEASQTSNNAVLSQEQEADIFYPDAEEIKIKDRKYFIKPLTLGQMKLLLQLSKLDLKAITVESIDSLTNGIAEILGEEDKVFIEKNVNVHLIKEIFTKVRSQTYVGIPQSTKGAQAGN